MPSTKLFSFLPVVVAGSAAAGGILGAFVAVGLVASPAPHTAASKPVAQAVKPEASVAKAAPPIPHIAETTGSASAADSSANCDQQTWPDLSRPCMEVWQRKNRNVRVISTDKVDRPTTAAAAQQPQPAKQEPAASALAAAGGSAAAAMPVTTSEPWFNPTALSTMNVPAQQAWDSGASKDSVASKDDSKKDEAKPETAKDEAAVKPKRTAKHRHKAPKADDDDQDSAVAGTDRNDGPRRAVADRRSQREYRGSRDYDVPSDDGGQRRVVVIRRGGGGLFENLFGMGRGGDGEDD